MDKSAPEPTTDSPATEPQSAREGYETPMDDSLDPHEPAEEVKKGRSMTVGQSTAVKPLFPVKHGSPLTPHAVKQLGGSPQMKARDKDEKKKEDHKHKGKHIDLFKKHRHHDRKFEKTKSTSNLIELKEGIIVVPHRRDLIKPLQIKLEKDVKSDTDPSSKAPIFYGGSTVYVHDIDSEGWALVGNGITRAWTELKAVVTPETLALVTSDSRFDYKKSLAKNVSEADPREGEGAEDAVVKAGSERQKELGEWLRTKRMPYSALVEKGIVTECSVKGPLEVQKRIWKNMNIAKINMLLSGSAKKDGSEDEEKETPVSARNSPLRRKFTFTGEGVDLKRVMSSGMLRIDEHRRHHDEDDDDEEEGRRRESRRSKHHKSKDRKRSSRHRKEKEGEGSDGSAEEKKSRKHRHHRKHRHSSGKPKSDVYEMGAVVLDLSREDGEKKEKRDGDEEKRKKEGVVSITKTDISVVISNEQEDISKSGKDNEIRIEVENKTKDRLELPKEEQKSDDEIEIKITDSPIKEEKKEDDKIEIKITDTPVEPPKEEEKEEPSDEKKEDDKKPEEKIEIKITDGPTKEEKKEEEKIEIKITDTPVEPPKEEEKEELSDEKKDEDKKSEDKIEIKITDTPVEPPKEEKEKPSDEKKDEEKKGDIIEIKVPTPEQSQTKKLDGDNSEIPPPPLPPSPIPPPSVPPPVTTGTKSPSTKVTSLEVEIPPPSVPPPPPEATPRTRARTTTPTAGLRVEIPPPSIPPPPGTSKTRPTTPTSRARVTTPTSGTKPTTPIAEAKQEIVLVAELKPEPQTARTPITETKPEESTISTTVVNGEQQQTPTTEVKPEPTTTPTTETKPEPQTADKQETEDKQESTTPEIKAESEIKPEVPTTETKTESETPTPEVKIDSETTPTTEIKIEVNEKVQEAVKLFNEKPAKGLKMLQDLGVVGTDAKDVAELLHARGRELGIDDKMVGDFLGSDGCKAYLNAYLERINFVHMDFDSALRRFLSVFHLPGEGQKIDRVMESFGERFYEDTKDAFFADKDAVFTLAFSAIMLNTDHYNPSIKKKMTLKQFMNNLRGSNGGRNFDAAFLEVLYAQICCCPLMFPETAVFPMAYKRGWLLQELNMMNSKRRWFVLDVDGIRSFRTTSPKDAKHFYPLESLSFDVKFDRKRKFVLNALCDGSSEPIKLKVTADNAIAYNSWIEILTHLIGDHTPITPSAHATSSASTSASPTPATSSLGGGGAAGLTSPPGTPTATHSGGMFGASTNSLSSMSASRSASASGSESGSSYSSGSSGSSRSSGASSRSSWSSRSSGASSASSASSSSTGDYTSSNGSLAGTPRSPLLNEKIVVPTPSGAAAASSAGGRKRAQSSSKGGGGGGNGEEEKGFHKIVKSRSRSRSVSVNEDGARPKSRSRFSSVSQTETPYKSSEPGIKITLSSANEQPPTKKDKNKEKESEGKVVLNIEEAKGDNNDNNNNEDGGIPEEVFGEQGLLFSLEESGTKKLARVSTFYVVVLNSSLTKVFTVARGEHKAGVASYVAATRNAGSVTGEDVARRIRGSICTFLGCGTQEDARSVRGAFSLIHSGPGTAPIFGYVLETEGLPFEERDPARGWMAVAEVFDNSEVWMEVLTKRNVYKVKAWVEKNAKKAAETKK